MPLWAILVIVGAVVAFLAHSGIGTLLIVIGLILLLVDLLGGVRR